MRSIRTACAAALAVAFFTVPAAAQKSKQPDGKSENGSFAEQLIKRIKANDKNGDGKITKQEASGRLKSRFDRFDLNSDGVIDESELKKLVDRIGSGRRPGGRRPGGRRPGGRRPGGRRPGGQGSESSAAAEGKTAPDFKLKTLDGKREVQLSSLQGKPVALIFGSYT